MREGLLPALIFILLYLFIYLLCHASGRKITSVLAAFSLNLTA